MILRAFIDADHLITAERAERQRQIAAEMRRVAKASERALPSDQRRQVLDVRGLAQAQQVECTAVWSRWDWVRWGTPWLLGLGLGALTDLYVRVFA